MPLATVILLAGLTSIPQDINDAAEVDGASLLAATLLHPHPACCCRSRPSPCSTGIVFTFTDMAVVYILTRGGPFDSTQVLASWAFYNGIEGGSLGQGAAIALFLFPVLVGVAALMLRLARKSETT